MTDGVLLERVRAGDDDALGALLARHAPSILRFGVKMCRDEEDARDVLQDTLLAAARGIRDFRGASSLSTWLFAIARSFCIKKRRTGKHAPKSHEIEPLDATIPSRARDPETGAADRELRDALDEGIRALEPAQREVLVLRDVEGLTAPEAAEVLGISIEATKSRLHRARAELRAHLEPFLPAAEHIAPPSSGCPEIVSTFSRFLENEIDEVDCRAMQAHVSSCARCAAACDSLKHVLAMCKASPAGEVPGEIQKMIRDSIRRARGEGVTKA